MISVVDVSNLGYFPRQKSGLFACAASPDPVARMQTSALFAGLSSAECSDIYSGAREKTFFRTEKLFSQGEPVRKLILIQSGRVKLTQLNANGNEVLLWVNGPGDAVDVHADAVGRSHTCSAHAMQRCQALIWEFSGFRAITVRYPQIHANIAMILATRLSEIEERFCEIATREIEDRLALLLVRLSKSAGKKVRAGVELELSRKELAQMTGATTCTVSRILSRWNQLGWIVARRGSVTITNAGGMRLSLDVERDVERLGVHCGGQRN